MTYLDEAYNLIGKTQFIPLKTFHIYFSHPLHARKTLRQNGSQHETTVFSTNYNPEGQRVKLLEMTGALWEDIINIYTYICFLKKDLQWTNRQLSQSQCSNCQDWQNSLFNSFCLYNDFSPVTFFSNCSFFFLVWIPTMTSTPYLKDKLFL